jgi:hypothetical protein
VGLSVSYKFIGRVGNLVKYGYGIDSNKLDGVFIVDFSKVKGEINKENEKDVYIDLVNPCNGEQDGCPLLGMAFVEILKHYQEHGTYSENSGDKEVQ